MGRLLLVRHGETAMNASGHYVSTSDPELSPRGRAQASALASTLAGCRLEAILTSPSRRCVETARAIRESQQDAVTLREDRRLVELGFGELEGLGESEIARQGLTEVFRAWRQGSPPLYPDGAETFEAAAERIGPVFDDVLPVDGIVAIVGHSHSLRILLCSRVLGVDAAVHRRLRIDHATITEIVWEQDTPRLASLNAAELAENRGPSS